MSNQIIVRVSGSSNSLRALEVAVDLARQRRLEIDLLQVVPPGGVPRACGSGPRDGFFPRIGRGFIPVSSSHHPVRRRGG